MNALAKRIEQLLVDDDVRTAESDSVARALPCDHCHARRQPEDLVLRGRFLLCAEHVHTHADHGACARTACRDCSGEGQLHEADDDGPYFVTCGKCDGFGCYP